ncbi:MAG: chloride channel protein [Planctomycetes bacterium]|nr:chloride channel protein [Planctomycetota bacterium]MCB9885637.1 chloride channel protein [Planctomycetota bacterium]
MAVARRIPLRAFAIYLFAAAIGVAGGAVGSVFQIGLNWIQWFTTGVDIEGHQDFSEAVAKNLNAWQTVLVPTAGGLAAGLVLLLLRGKKPPFGVSDLIGLVQLRKGTIRVRESVTQIISSACSIGSGGSIGREGANLQIAATFAAVFERWAKLGSRPRAVLIGCGVAAGMASSYNAPIAGAIFVMEVVLGNFAMNVFAPIVLSSVLATILRKLLLSEKPIYEVASEHVATLSPGLILAALLLGVMCGFGSIFFRTVLKLGKDGFKKLGLPLPLALALGGVIVGVIGLFRPETWGNGFEVVNLVAKGGLPLAMILTLFIWKQVATIATVGSGALGGIFTPNLVVGAAFGGVFAQALELFEPVSVAERTTFAFVGMAGLCAATMHAPVTAVVLVFELTGHQELILPVMLCSIAASITARMLDEDSYYTAAMKARGDAVPSGLEDLAIRSTYARDIQRDDCVTVGDTASFEDVMSQLGSHRGDTIYVQDGAGGLSGRIELQDVKSFINDPTLSSVVIAADVTRPVVTAYPDESIAALMPRFDDPELREIAIVSHGAPMRLLGRVRHQDVIAAIGSEVLGDQRRTTRLSLGGEEGSLNLPRGYTLRTIPLPDTWVGLAIDALPPADRRDLVVLLALHRDRGRDETVVATPDLVLQEGWRVVVLGRRETVLRLEQGSAPPEE